MQQKKAALPAKFDDENKRITIQGDLIFTKKGEISFDFPLSETLKDVHGIEVEPSSVEDQIESNRIMLLLTSVILGLACLTFSNDLRHR